jgi:hypothetical protein
MLFSSVFHAKNDAGLHSDTEFTQFSPQTGLKSGPKITRTGPKSPVQHQVRGDSRAPGGPRQAADHADQVSDACKARDAGKGGGGGGQERGRGG